MKLKYEFNVEEVSGLDFQQLGQLEHAIELYEGMVDFLQSFDPTDKLENVNKVLDEAICYMDEDNIVPTLKGMFHFFEKYPDCLSVFTLVVALKRDIEQLRKLYKNMIANDEIEGLE